MAEIVHFRVDTRLTALLGESYRSTEAALKELVDNAWDADAENVWITLPSPLTNEPIVFRDDGHGMTPQEVRGEYLNIARDRRTRKGDFTPKFKRKVKGRKGIGKFAGLAAARIMQLQTIARGQLTELVIDKEAILQAQTDLEEIPLPISSRSTSDHAGTTVTLTALNQSLSFPTEERLRLALIHEYGRAEHFRIIVNDTALSVDDLPGEAESHEEALDTAGPAKLRFTVAQGNKAPSNPGIVIKVGGKVVGKPSFFGLEDDPEIPRKLLSRIYGEVEVDGLEDHVTADWGAILENSKAYQELQHWVSRQARKALDRTYKREIDLQKARIQRQINQRLAQLPEHRRSFAEQAIHRVLSKFYGERDDRVATIANVVLDALEKDEYWIVVQNIDEARGSDIARLSEALEAFGLLEMVLISERAQHRLRFLDNLDALIANAETLESQIHVALEKSLWVLGPAYSIMSSNKSLGRVIEEYTDKKFTGPRRSKRPDLLLATDPGDRYLLIEFKRPSHVLDRDDESQAKEYRDDLTSHLQGKPIDILLLGGRRDPKQSAFYDTRDVKFMTYNDILSRCRQELEWLLRQI